MDRGRTAAALFALAACIACTIAAPTSDQTALEPLETPKDGCYYNFQHYGEGDRIMTNEPCLNCTCHNRMLMCYLRVCPFTKPIGQDCTIEKRADQCCPIVTCPDVPVDLLTSTSTNSPAEYGETGLGKLDKYGCSINGKYFPEGSKVPPSPNKPCEHCYCIRNMTTCVMQECTLHVDGCTPIYHKDVCCPVRYSCDHPEDEIPLLDDMTTTVRPTPGFLLTTTTMSITQPTQDCIHDDQIFPDGALIKTEKACEHCYCMKGDIVCVVQECGTPMENEGKNCTSLPPRQGQCCPDTYICEGDESETTSDVTTPITLELTTAPPRRIGVEGSGYRNEPDEPQTEVHTFIPDFEGSGEDRITSAILDTTEVSHIDKDLSDMATTTESVEKVNEVVDLNPEENITPGKQDKGEENTTELNNEVHDTNEENVSHTLEITTPIPEYIHTSTHTFSTVPKENEMVTESVNNVEDIDITQDKKTTVNELTENVTTEQVYTVTKADNENKITTMADEYQVHTEHSVTTQEITTQPSSEISESFSEYEPQEEHTVSKEEREQLTTQQQNNYLSTNEIKVTTPSLESISDKDHVSLAQEITTQGAESSSVNMPQEEQTIGNTEQEYTVTKSNDLATENKVSTPAHEDTAGTEQSISNQEITTQLPSGISTSSSVYEPLGEETTGSVGIIEAYITTTKEVLIETTSVNPIENEVEEDNTLQISSPGRIPGEGDCLLNSVTYKNNSLVPSTNNCHTSCKCISSIIKCDPIICSPPPEYMNDCEPIYDSPDSCCPTYICNTKETLPPQSHNQMSYIDMNRTVAASECNSNDCLAEVEKEKEPVPINQDCSGNDCTNLEKLCNEEHGCSDMSTNKCDGENCSISPDIIIANKTESSECNSNECTVTEEKEPTLNIKHCSGSECINSNQRCDKEHGCQDTPVPICEGEKCQVIPVPPNDNETNLQGDISVHLDTHTDSDECNDEACKNKKNQNAYPEQVSTFEQSTGTSVPLEHSTTSSYEPHKENEINLQSTEMPKYSTEATLGDFIAGQTTKHTETIEHSTASLESVTTTLEEEEKPEGYGPYETKTTQLPFDKESQFNLHGSSSDNAEIPLTERITSLTSQESPVTETYDHDDALLVPLVTEKDHLYSGLPDTTTQINTIDEKPEQPLKPDDTIVKEPAHEIIHEDQVTTQSDETATLKQSLGTLTVDLEDRVVTTSEKIFTEQNILYTNIPENSISNTDIFDSVTNKYEQESSTSYIETPTTLISQKATSENINTNVDDGQPITEENVQTSGEVTDTSTKQSNDGQFVTGQVDINTSGEVTDAPRKEINDELLTTEQVKLPDETTITSLQHSTSGTSIDEKYNLTTESSSFETTLPNTSEVIIPVNINEGTYLSTEKDLQNEQGSATTLSSNTNQHEKESDVIKEITEATTLQSVTLATKLEESGLNDITTDEHKTTVTNKEETYSESPEILNVKPINDTFLEDKEKPSETPYTLSVTPEHDDSLSEQTTKYSDIETEGFTNTPEKYLTTLDDNKSTSENMSETKVLDTDNLSTDVNKMEYITPSSIYPTKTDNGEYATVEAGNVYSLTSTNIPHTESSTSSKVGDSFEQGNKSEFTTATVVETTELYKDKELNLNITENKIDSTIAPVTDSVTTSDKLADRFATEEISSVTEKIYTNSPDNEVPQIITEQQVKEEKPYLGDQETILTTEHGEFSTLKDTEKDKNNEAGTLDKQTSPPEQTLETATPQPAEEIDITKHDDYNLEDNKKYTTEGQQITTQKTEDKNIISDKDVTIPVQGLEEIEKLTTPNLEANNENIEKLTTETEKEILLTSLPSSQEITTKASLVESSSTVTEYSRLGSTTTVSYNRLDTHDTENEPSTLSPVSQFSDISSETQNLNTEPTTITSSEEIQQKTTANLQPTTTDKIQLPEINVKDETHEKEKDTTTTSGELYPTTSNFENKFNQIDENTIGSQSPNVNTIVEEEIKTPQPEEGSTHATVSISDSASSEAPVSTSESQNVDKVSDVTTTKQGISELPSVTGIPSETTTFSLIKEDDSRTTLSKQQFTPSSTELSELKVKEQTSSEGSQDITISEATTEKLIPTPIQETSNVDTAEKVTDTPVYLSSQKETVETTIPTNIVTDKMFEESTSKPLDETENINITPQETETKLPIDVTDYLTTVEPKPIEEDIQSTIFEENKQGSTEKSVTILEVKPIVDYETEKQEPNTEAEPITVTTPLSNEPETTNLPSSQVTKLIENEILPDKQTESEIMTSDKTEKYDMGTEIPINYTSPESESATTSNALTASNERLSEQPEITTTKSSEYGPSEGVNLVTEIPSFSENQDIEGKPTTAAPHIISDTVTEPLSTVSVDISPSITVSKEPEDLGEATTVPPTSEGKVTSGYGSNMPNVPDLENKLDLTTVRNDLLETSEIINQSTETEIKYSETTPYYIELEEHTHQIKEEATPKITSAEETVTTNYEPHQTERGDIENTDKYSEENLEVEPLTEKIITQGEEHLPETTSHVIGEEILVEGLTDSTDKPKTHGTESLVESTSPYTLKEDEKEVPSTVASHSVQEEAYENVMGSSPSSIIPSETTTLASPTEKATTSNTEILTSTEKQIIGETAMPEILVETSSSDEELLIATSKLTTVKVTEEIGTQLADISKNEEKPEDSYITPETTKPDYSLQPSEKPEDSYISPQTTKPDYSQQPSEKPDDSYISPETTKPDYSQQPSEKPDDSYMSPETTKPDDSQQPSEEIPPDFPPSAGGYGQETDYVEEDQAFGPGTCRYGGKVYVSAQQIPRDDPCDFCFCFRSDIICLQQSCPPPIHGCHEEPIQGFCCPRYECPVSMATAVNVTTTTTTTTTTLPPHFLPHAYKGAAQRRGCQIKGHTYKVGEVVRASSGPCLHCTCGGDGQMKCDPKVCTPEPMLRQMIAAAVSTDRRR